MQIGCDPEIFAFKGEEVIPAFRFLRSKKRIDQLPISTMHSSRAYWDGYQAEFRFTGGFACLQEMVGAIQQALLKMHRQLNRIVPQSNLSIKNTVRLSRTELQTAPEEFLSFGCSPSLNAYNLQANPIHDPRSVPWRWAGGHMHFSHLPNDIDPITVIKRLDKVVGVWAVGAARNFDVPVRRQFYGLSGEYRVPKYALLEVIPRIQNNRFIGIQYKKAGTTTGVEWRTLSNFWLAHPRITHITFEIARKAILFGDSWQSTDNETIDVIQNMDYDAATKIIERNATWFHCLGDRFSLNNINEAIAVGTKGIENSCNPNNVTENWHLKNKDRWGYYDIPIWDI